MSIKLDSWSIQGVRPTMEDEHLYFEYKGTNYFFVLDGHGGDRVAKLVKNKLLYTTAIRSMMDDIDWNSKSDVKFKFQAMFNKINDSIPPKLSNSGTTLIGLAVPDGYTTGYLINIGDSRGVVYNSTGDIVTESVDQKPSNSSERKRIVAAGGTVLNMFGVQRVNGILSVSRAIGDHHLKRSGVVPIVEVYPVDLTVAHTIILACDGLWDVIESKDVDTSLTSRQLVEHASERCSTDNITVMRIRPTKIDIQKPVDKTDRKMKETILSKLGQFESSSRSAGEGFKASAYGKAIRTLRELDQIPTTKKELMELPGIGKSIAEKIIAIQNDTLEDTLDNTMMDSFEEFLKVWGVGPVKAKELWQAGARTIKDLSKRRYQELLTTNQRLGVLYFDDLQQRVNYNEVDKLGKTIIKAMKAFDPNLKPVICGSYRRARPDCGDIDILVTNVNLKELMRSLYKTEDWLVENLGLGKTKYFGIAITDKSEYNSGNARAQYIRIDVEVVPELEFPYALLYFTGSDTFNKRQRSIALKRGYNLSEHGLKKISSGDYVKGIKTEKGIFKFLDMEYVEPKDR